MKEITKADNAVSTTAGLANPFSINLQLFADEGGTEPTVISDPVEPATEPMVEPVRDPTQDVTQTKAFAQRLKDEGAKIESRTKDALIAELSGGQFQTYDEYLEFQQAQAEEQKRLELEQQGINPDELLQLVEEQVTQHPDVQWANQLKQQQEEENRFNDEAGELFGAYKDLNPQDIPPEVWKLKAEKGLSLLDAYNRVMMNNRPDPQQAEQEAIKKYFEKLKGGYKPVEGSGVSSVVVKDNPKTFEDAKKGALAMLRSMKQ